MNTSPNTPKSEEGKSCSTGGCGMKICSPCVMMKIVMVGVIAYQGFKYFAG
jgi:hypothetical protein